MWKIHQILSKYPKKVVLGFLCFLSIGHYVFAVDGIIVGNKKATKTFSNIKSDLHLSLNSGFHYHQNKNFNSRKSINSPRVDNNSVITYQKGNVIWVLPQRNTLKIIVDKFKTPSPVIR
ncbi:MAG: hypothetical protein ACO29O_06025 [Chitinophagaceae bacterium]